MSYGNAEISMEHGSPVTLYLFKVGAGANDVYCYTDSDKPENYGGRTYSQETISRTEIDMDGTLNKQKITVSMPMNNAVANLFTQYPPSYVVTVTIFEGHFLDTDKQFVQIMQCRVLSCEKTGIEAQLTCEPASTSLRRIGLRRYYQRQCPLSLYGRRCGAASTAISVAKVSTGTNSITVTLSTLPESYRGGTLKWTNSVTGRLEVRTIISVSGSGTTYTLTVTGPVTNVPATVVVERGCDHTEATCQAWHNNLVNFGGQPWIPFKSPFNTISEFF